MLDYHLRLFLPKEIRSIAFDTAEATWISSHFEAFNHLAASEERFRFALEAAMDWRYARDARAAVARVWSGVESVLAISAELAYRVALCAATVLAPRGPERVAAFKRVKGLYGVRSKAVHGEPISHDKLLTGLYESFELLRALLLDVADRGTVRTEEDYAQALLT